MANRKLIIQRNTSYPVVDTPKTLFLVRLAWLLGKPIAINQIPDQITIGDSPDMIIETLITDQIALISMPSDISLSNISDAMSLEVLPDQLAIETKQ